MQLLQADGSLQGGNDLRAYYKTPFALASTGHVAEAERVLDHIATRYLKANGDLDGTGVPWFGIYRTYQHSWLCCAAMMRGRFELAWPLSNFIAGYHDTHSGGFFADEKRSTQEIMTTSMAGLACLWAGRLDIATAAGRWLGNLFAAQPDLRRGLYTAWRGGLVTGYKADEAAGCLVDAAKPRQWYFQYGISAALLSSLAARTGEQKWLKLARDFLDASRYCADDRYRTPQSGKIGWGAAWTYRLSQNPGDAELARQVCEGLCAMQNRDGSWLATGAYGVERADASSEVIDVTAEFVSLQAAIGLVKGV